MKRSEMINVLDEAINSQLYQDYLFDEDMLNLVLIAIEKAGMLPPETKATPEDFSNLDLHQDFLDEHDFSVNKWEPEDD